MSRFKPGDLVVLTGHAWDSEYPRERGLARGMVVTIEECDVTEGEGAFVAGKDQTPWYVTSDGSWAAELTLRGANNFEQVENLKAGTVFQFLNGAPWLRTTTGVHDLMIAAHYPASPLNGPDPIPEQWRDFHYQITLLYTQPRD